jgi:hypothetical protein
MNKSLALFVNAEFGIFTLLSFAKDEALGFSSAIFNVVVHRLEIKNTNGKKKKFMAL